MSLKITMLVPGTGNFFCGSCLRDHSLAKGLIKLGHDATMVPLYLPHVAEDNIETAPLFFGGINVYLQQFSFYKYIPKFIIKKLDQPKLLKFISRFSGFTSAKTLGKLTLSSLEINEVNNNVEFNKMVDWLKNSNKPDCIILSNCLLAGFAKTLKEVLSCPVFCTLQGEDSFLDSLIEPYRSKSWAELKDCAKHIELFMPVSKTYGEIMKERMDIDDTKISHVYNGIELEDIPHEAQPSEEFIIAFLANIIPDKGLSTLVDAFIHLKSILQNKPLKLMILGSTTPFTKNYLESVKSKLEQNKLLDQTIIKTNLTKEDKFKYLSRASILSVPATYGESFGLYIIEALALGIPVVQPNHGAFPEIIEATEGGLLCKPDDSNDLADKIHELYNNPELRAKLGAQGKKKVVKGFNNHAMAKRVSELISTKCKN
jgi:glycosyltransferase involved in cell wall biosynthesis